MTLTQRLPPLPFADATPVVLPRVLKNKMVISRKVGNTVFIRTYLFASEDGVRPPNTSSSSRELEPGRGDLGVSDVVLQSKRSAWLLPLEVEAEIPFPRPP